MLEPRRLAAAAVAARISELLGEPLGRRAGYRVRSAVRVGPETRLEVITEALLSRALEADPLLADTGLVILDEFHERSIHADLALALLLETRRARPDLALLLMSATLDADRVAAFISADDPAGPAPVIECPGRLFPVQTEYRPLSGSDRWEGEFADLVAGLLPGAGGDVLVFLPGLREIERVAAKLSRAAVRAAGRRDRGHRGVPPPRFAPARAPAGGAAAARPRGGPARGARHLDRGNQPHGAGDRARRGRRLVTHRGAPPRDRSRAARHGTGQHRVRGPAPWPRGQARPGPLRAGLEGERAAVRPSGTRDPAHRSLGAGAGVRAVGRAGRRQPAMARSSSAGLVGSGP